MRTFFDLLRTHVQAEEQTGRDIATAFALHTAVRLKVPGPAVAQTSGSVCSAQMTLPLVVCLAPQPWHVWATRSSPRPPSS
jgi:hypothetical protein